MEKVNFSDEIVSADTVRLVLHATRQSHADGSGPIRPECGGR